MRENPHIKVARSRSKIIKIAQPETPVPPCTKNLRDLCDLCVSVLRPNGNSPALTRLMNSILVVQLKRLGDLILTTPALSALRKIYPEAQITLLIDHHSAELAPAIADVNEVLIYKKNGSFNLWFDLVRREFDLCLDFTGNDRSALVSFLSKAAQRVGFSFVAKRAIRSWVYTRLVQSAVRERHTVDHYIDLVRSLGDFGSAGGVSLRLPDSVERSAETLRRETWLARALLRRSSGLSEAGQVLAGRSLESRDCACTKTAWDSVPDHRRPKSGRTGAYPGDCYGNASPIYDLQFGRQGRLSLERCDDSGRNLVYRRRHVGCAPGSSVSAT